MSYSLSGVLAKCGVRDPGTQPFSAPCPLCQTSDALEVRGPNCVVCKGCDFIGDAYELYAAYSKQTLAQAIAELDLEGLTDMTPERTGGYLYEREENAKLIAIWRQGQKRVSEGPSSIRSLLQNLQCFTNDAQFTRLSKNHAALRAEDFETLILTDKSTKQTLRHMGLYTHLAIPCWYESFLTGFWLIQDRAFDAGYGYLHLRSEIASLGYGHAINPMDELCFVVNDPRVAVRFMTRQAIDQAVPVTFVVPGPWSRVPAHMFGCREVIFFPTNGGFDQVRYYAEAARFFTGGAKVILDSKLKFIPLSQWPAGATSSTGILRQLRDHAIPAYQGLGAFLLTRPQVEASRHTVAWSLDLLEQNQVLNFFSGTDQAFLKRCFETDTKMTKITFDGQQIIETKEGWTCEGKLISEAIIRIDEVNTNRESGVTLVTGTVSFVDTGTSQTRVISFKEDLAQIERSPAAWLKRFVLANGGWVEVSSKWSTKLLSIAKKFSISKMNVVATDKPYGWGVDRALRFNRFMVDHHGISRAISKVTGPDIPYPPPLTPSEVDAFGSKEFCMTALVLLGNLYRTSLKLPGLSVVVPSAPHIVERIAAAFGQPQERNPDRNRLLRDASSPLPCFSVWSDDQLAELVRQDAPCHIMCSVDTRTFKLMGVSRGWIRLPVDSLSDYRALRWVFYGLIPLLLEGIQIPDDGYFFSTLAKRVVHLVGRMKPQHQLIIAAVELDHNALLNRSSWGTQTMRLLRMLVDSGDLPCQATTDGYKLLHQDVVAAMASPILPPPDIRQLTKQLADGKMLVDMSPTSWTINGTMWNLVASNLSN